MTEKENYRAAFIIPRGSKKVLGEDGWDFVGGDYLPEEIEEFLVSELGVKATEDYLDMRDYAGEGIKAAVFFDGRRKIENVYFQVYGHTAMEMLEGIFEVSGIAKYSELFVPNREGSTEHTGESGFQHHSRSLESEMNTAVGLG